MSDLKRRFGKTTEPSVQRGFLSSKKTLKISATRNGVRTLNINENYRVEILGLGEVYEIASIERLRKRLKKTYGNGILFLASNRDHSSRGLTLEELIEYVKSCGLKATEAGYVDSPPWPSRKRETPRSLISHVIIIFLARRLFDVLSGFERFTSSRRRAHLVYCFSVFDKVRGGACAENS
jgi:hypothetical protein